MSAGLESRVRELRDGARVRGAQVMRQLREDEKVHDFRASLRRGQAMEREVKFLLEELGFRTYPATKEEQLAGIDMTIRVRKDSLPGCMRSLEVKFDERAEETGNIFVELYSNEQSRRKGWAYTSTADVLLVVVPEKGHQHLFFIRPPALRAALPAWRAEYREARAQNATFNSLGVLVPLHELDRIAHVSMLGCELNGFDDEGQRELIRYCLG